MVAQARQLGNAGGVRTCKRNVLQEGRRVERDLTQVESQVSSAATEQGHGAFFFWTKG
jgi:hypothetical protein